jgi:cyclopropane fatty-acyl-phospholipid synthase-like methyltransferase
MKESRKIYLYKKRADFIFEQMAKYNVRGGAMLDVGGGWEEMAECLAEKNLFDSITVVEPQSLEINLPKIKVINAFFEDCKLTEKFNVITSFEVIEQVINPDKFLSKIRDSLNDNGIFIFSTPNINGFETSTLRGLSTSVRFAHVRLYNLKSIKILLERNGFEVLDLQTPGELDVEMVYKRFTDGKLSIENNPALRFLLEDGYIYREQFQAFLQKNLMSSHMKGVAKKKIL